jgi:hypothetical protein
VYGTLELRVMGASSACVPLDCWRKSNLEKQKEIYQLGIAKIKYKYFVVSWTRIMIPESILKHKFVSKFANCREWAKRWYRCGTRVWNMDRMNYNVARLALP